ncbi:hypothetical protein Rcae01_03893 [Novipirellula caenicola]|uniref:Uncharacterized protein n=1 Tax=Novipirellula caenicola TaxID=1536901 RepID=A0ABP9VTE6_9BACT
MRTTISGSITCPLIILLLGFPSVLADDATLKKDADKETHPLQDRVFEYARNYLLAAEEVNKDYACWIDCEIQGVGPHRPGPVSEKQTFIFAANKKNDWKYWASTSNDSVDARIPYWEQVLSTGLHKKMRRGISSHMNVRNSENKQEVKPTVPYRSPFYLSLVRYSTFASHPVDEDYVSRMLFEVCELIDAEYDKDSGDMVATWRRQFHGLASEFTIRFAKDEGYLPTRSVYTLVREESRRVFSLCETKWERNGSHRVPVSYRVMDEDASGKTHYEYEFALEWKTGEDNPDMYPETSVHDWRLGYCKLFKRKCYDQGQVDDDRRALTDFMFSEKLREDSEKSSD